MKPTRILFLGNSFTNRNDVPGMLARLAAAASPAHRVESDRVIENGVALKTHWDHGTALKEIELGTWNYVVLQEQSTLPLKNPARMHEYITRFDGEIRKHHGKTVLYMTWARKHEWDRQPKLAEAYTSIGHALGAIVVPVGTAWQRVLVSHPDLPLHDKDKSHPTFAGSYVAACVFFAKLFGQSPVDLDTPDGAEVERKTPGAARIIQEAAWETAGHR